MEAQIVLTFIFLVAFALLLTFNEMIYRRLGLAICDPIAGILGINLQQYNHRIRIFNHTMDETWLGSSAFFISCFIISIIALYFNQEHLNINTFITAVTIALVSTLAELFSRKGIDNLLIPLSLLLVLIVML